MGFSLLTVTGYIILLFGVFSSPFKKWLSKKIITRMLTYSKTASVVPLSITQDNLIKFTVNNKGSFLEKINDVRLGPSWSDVSQILGFLLSSTDLFVDQVDNIIFGRRFDTLVISMGDRGRDMSIFIDLEAYSRLCRRAIFCCVVALTSGLSLIAFS